MRLFEIAAQAKTLYLDVAHRFERRHVMVIAGRRSIEVYNEGSGLEPMAFGVDPRSYEADAFKDNLETRGYNFKDVTDLWSTKASVLKAIDRGDTDKVAKSFANRSIENDFVSEEEETLNPPSISVGDEVKVGKWKNRKAEVKGFTKDDHGQPVLKTTKGDQKLYKPRVTKLEPKEVDEAAFKRQEVDHSLPYDDHEEGAYKNELDGRNTKKELWRGPHEGRYLQLFLAGKKPAIVIDDDQMEPFKKYVESGQLIQFPLLMPDSPQMTWEIFVLTIPGQEWRAKKIQSLFIDRPEYEGAGKNKLWHARLGILLGYTNADVRQFINTVY